MSKKSFRKLTILGIGIIIFLAISHIIGVVTSYHSILTVLTPEARIGIAAAFWSVVMIIYLGVCFLLNKYIMEKYF